MPSVLLYGGCARAGFGLAGFVSPGFPPRVQSASSRVETTLAVRPTHGEPPMTLRHILSLNPLKNRASAHRRMALAALHANSSLSTRLKRYNAHMHIARALEAGVEVRRG